MDSGIIRVVRQKSRLSVDCRNVSLRIVTSDRDADCLVGDEKAQAVLPIPIHDLSIGRSHAVAVLDNAVTIDQAK